jgi:hypothetical protein
MTKGHQSSYNESAASAWCQQNVDWWSRLKKYQDTHHPTHSATTNGKVMDMDDEAAGRLKSTDLHCIIAAALEGHDKQPTDYHALRHK